jgi:hypothetical protein
MSEKYNVGDIVYLTPAAQDFLSRNRGPSFNISVVGRLGKIIEIYDWKTARGKQILDERKKHPNWSKIPNSLDFKYVVVTAYPELKSDQEAEQGLCIPDLFCEFHPMAPDKKVPLFRKWPNDILESFIKKEENKKKVPNVSRPADKPSTRKPGKLPRGTKLPTPKKNKR